MRKFMHQVVFFTSFASFVWAVPMIQPMEVTKPAMEVTTPVRGIVIEARDKIILPIDFNGSNDNNGSSTETTNDNNGSSTETTNDNNGSSTNTTNDNNGSDNEPINNNTPKDESKGAGAMGYLLPLLALLFLYRKEES